MFPVNIESDVVLPGIFWVVIAWLDAFKDKEEWLSESFVIDKETESFSGSVMLVIVNKSIPIDVALLAIFKPFSEISKFCLISETHRCDPWFVFQRFLL